MLMLVSGANTNTQPLCLPSRSIHARTHQMHMQKYISVLSAPKCDTFCLTTKGIPTSTHHCPPHLPTWQKQGLGLPPSALALPAQDRPCPACPSLLGWGPACSQCQLPAQHRTGCPLLQHVVASPTPSPSLATSACGPHLTHFSASL